MNESSGTWSPYAGGGSILLAVVLFLITGTLLYLATRLRRPLTVKRPGTFLRSLLIVVWVLSVLTFLVAITAYTEALQNQVGSINAPTDPITPVTVVSAVVSFFVIVALAQRSGLGIAVGSAIVGTIAAPMIFEFPFDLIVMWRTYPPAPHTMYTLLFFFPLFLVELLSFAMLTFSPVMKLSKYTLFFLAGMFLIFAVWAAFGFGYPLTPLTFTMNVTSKILAFATAVSLFLPLDRITKKSELV